ncbi:hypothetical protein [Streptomyces sp. NPDC002265]|uniref:hypothetical protein n=1 Tax=Streptomyces sp. NPDC002265 TaxID=3154415 RepID=UPI003323C200
MGEEGEHVNEFVDDTVDRRLDQQAGMRETLLLDPVQQAQVESMRRMLTAADRAIADEGVTDEVQQRVVNQFVWGEPEDHVDARSQMMATVEAMALSIAGHLDREGHEWAP